jgi:CHASE1-domain containing sensor protein
LVNSGKPFYIHHQTLRNRQAFEEAAQLSEEELRQRVKKSIEDLVPSHLENIWTFAWENMWKDMWKKYVAQICGKI